MDEFWFGKVRNFRTWVETLRPLAGPNTWEHAQDRICFLWKLYTWDLVYHLRFQYGLMGLPYWQILLDCLGTPADHRDHGFALSKCVEAQSLNACWTCRMGYILDVQDICATTFPNFQNCCSTTTAKSEVDILNFCTLWDVSFFKYFLGGSLPGQCIERVCVASGTRMSVFAGWLWFQKHRGLGCFWMCKKKTGPTAVVLDRQVTTSASSFLHGGSQRWVWRLCAAPRPRGRSSVRTGRLRTTRTGGDWMSDKDVVHSGSYAMNCSEI